MIGRLHSGRFVPRVLILGAAGSLALSLIAPALAAPATSNAPITLVADHIEYNTQTGAAVADGHVRASQDDVVITADHLTGNLQTGDVEATGHVTLTRGRQTATGTSLRYNYRTRVGRMEQVASAYGPWTVNSQVLETSEHQGTAYNASVTPCDPQHPAFRVTARKVVVVPDDYLAAYDATLFVYGVPVATIPTYTASLKRGRRAQSGPSVGYNNPDGAWIEYSQYSPIGSASNQLRIRYGTRSAVSAEDILSQRVEDHVWSLHLGRAQTFDQGGNLLLVDQYSLDLTYNQRRVADWPVYYTLEAHAGSYGELASGVTTTRGEAWLNLSSDVMHLSPTLVWATSGQARFDEYGTGQQRTVLGYTVSVTDVLDPSNSVSLSYNLAAVTGATPFQFDTISSDSTVALSYSYGGAGFVQTAGTSVSYSFLTQQTSLGLNVALAVTPQMLLSASTSYNLSTQQWGETDYAISVRCDCVTVGILYRTFPQTPSQNTFYLTVGLTPFPETFGTVRF